MKRIFKIKLGSKEQVIGDVHISKILCAKVQFEEVVLYYEMDEDTVSNECYKIIRCNTGEELPEDIDTYTYLDTVMLCSGAIVQHVYYKAMEV